MKSLESILVVLFSIITASTIVSCDSKPSTANSYANEDVYEEESQKTFQCTLCSGYGVYAGYTCNRCGGTGEIVAEYVETRSNSDVSFRGRSFYYGRCNSGCGCQITSINQVRQSALIVLQMDVQPQNYIIRKNIDTSGQ